MKSFFNLSFLLSIAVFISSLLLIPEAGRADDSVIRSTSKDRLSIGLTIYNQNFALVREERGLTSSLRGKREILFEDVPVQIEPDTIFIETGDKELPIVEQKFEYDLITPEKVLEHYVGKTVKILEKNRETGKKNILEAELVSFNNNQPIYRIGGEIYLGYPEATVIVPGLPEQLTVRPTLRWLLGNMAPKSEEKGSERSISAHYLTRGLNWKANYIFQVSPQETQGDLLSWVTIENQSGASFEKARIKLVAGEVQRAEETGRIVRRMRAAESFEAVRAPFEEESLAEYHLYTLDRTSTLKDQQATQIPFLKASRVPMQKEFVFWGEGIYNRRQPDFPETPRPARVYVKLENKKEHNLGFPLPQGTMKVYQREQTGSLEFIGEDRLRHTPVGETLRLRVGNAFDVTGVQKQMEWEKIAAQTFESSWQVTLRNQKSEKIIIRVIEPITGEWKVVSSSHPYKRLEAQRIEFSVPVPARGEEILTYRIRVEF